MNRLSAIFIKQPLLGGLISRYKRYRSYHTPRLIALLFTTILAGIWLVFNTDSKAWQRLIRHHKSLFPHIDYNRPRLGDLIRYPLQILWLLMVYVGPHKEPYYKKINATLSKALSKYRQFVYKVLFSSRKMRGKAKRTTTVLSMNYPYLYYLIIVIMTLIAIVCIVMSITRFFETTEQLIFLLILWFAALSIMELPSRTAKIILALLSIIATSRYLWWRYTTTLIWEDWISQLFGTLLILAETYVAIVLVLGYFQSIWPLHRQPVELPDDPEQWPEVDIFFTTYDEELSILKPGVYAALGIDWPKDKLNVYILDDGNRPEFKAFAQECEVHYIARKDNKNAKAGNINNALKYSNGEFIAMFDCDFIPTRSFLQLTIGWFLKDRKLGLLQTPHHFFSQDPFEKNLHTPDSTPNENQLFYSVLQDGNDIWNATFFCGSAGIFRRKALEENGGMSTESVTEDALTSLNIQRLGYSSAYIRIPLAAGLATNNMVDHLGQRVRWARGMAQIFRVNNPLLGKGLSFAQRICYFNAILYFFSGIPRLIFFISPMAFLLFGGYIFYAPALMVIFYATPHLIHGVIANSRIQGKYRHFMWNEIYETVMSYYIALPTTLALLNPKLGKFNVTSKGKLTKEVYTDWQSAKPYIGLAMLNMAGIIVGIWSLIFHEGINVAAILITSAWATYNLIILGGVLGAHVESKQVRKSPRVTLNLPAAIRRHDGHTFVCTLVDYSDIGVGIQSRNQESLNTGDKVTLYIIRDKETYYFNGVVQRSEQNHVGIQLDNMSKQYWIEFIQCTFARSDTWAIKQNNYSIEHPVQSMKEVFRLSVIGYKSVIYFAPIFIQVILLRFYRAYSKIRSFLPQKVKLYQ